MTTDEKLAKLRKQMKKNRVKALVIPTSDPHLSEYLPEHWKIREWLSGFTGSAGTLVVSSDKAALWVDSRYFLQAEQQLQGSQVELCKMGLPSTPSINNWLKINVKEEGTVGFNAKLFSITEATELINSIKTMGFKHDATCEFIASIWDNRPSLPTNQAFIHKLEFAKISIQEKLGKIRKHLMANNANSYLMCALDEVCWTFNLRGSDIAYNPVVLSFGYIDDDRAVLFVDPAKLTDNDKRIFANENVEIKDYRKLDKFLSKLPMNEVMVLDPDRTNYHIYKQIPSRVHILRMQGFATGAKGRKSPAEIDGFRQAMVQDGVALAQFFCWLENSVTTEKLSEINIAEKLLDFRKKRQHFVSESFAPIVAYKEHGAIVHYDATPETNSNVLADGFLLLDTGGQYLNGTTDITRTVHLGTPNSEEKFHYTLILKAMIGLAMARFPYGTRGCQLDTFARAPLWNQGLNFGHGTGHGVGYFLNVHEGPQQIRPENTHTILPGMVMSDEPGIYIAGRYGIRIENLLVCNEWTSNDYGRFLAFETLTLCPIDTKPIDVNMLTDTERKWLNTYHSTVYKRLAPHLPDEVKTWLANKTAAI